MIRNSQQTTTTIELLANNLQHWEQLLFTAGGKLELSKCCYVNFTWKFDDDDRATMISQENNATIEIQDSQTKEMQQISAINVTTPYKLLGVHMSLDGDDDAQLKAIQEKCDKITMAFL